MLYLSHLHNHADSLGSLPHLCASHSVRLSSSKFKVHDLDPFKGLVFFSKQMHCLYCIGEASYCSSIINFNLKKRFI